MMRTNTRYHAFIPFFLITLPFPLFTWFLAGFHNNFWFSSFQLVYLFLFTGIAVGLVLFLHLCSSIFHINRYITPVTKQINITEVWKNHYPITDAFLSTLLMTGLNLANLGLPMVAELYKQTASIWYDQVLWEFEKPLFHIIQDLIIPVIPTSNWESIYLAMWIYVIGVMSALLIAKRDHIAVEMVMVVVLMFHLRQIIALFFPTMGPGAYQPESFLYIDGSLSFKLQHLLMAYQDGHIPQNGMIFGMVAMPSLHVGLTFLAGYYLVKLYRGLLLISFLWLAIIWMSTVILGWHYVLDGFGGILIAIVSIPLARWLIARMNLAVKIMMKTA
jgi:hypothetical protein